MSVNGTKRNRLYLFSALLLALLVWLGSRPLPHSSAEAGVRSIQAPALKWEHGGCYASWCETGWYSSPAVADLDSDGMPEVIASAYSIFVLDGNSGELEWQAASGHDRSESDAESVGRTWPGTVVADVDADGGLEIVTAHDSGYVSVYAASGYFEPGWPQQPTTNELRGLSVYDLDGNGTLEIVVTGAVYNETNTWVFDHNGELSPGWPQLVGDSGYAHGVFNDNAALGDLDGDGLGEVVVPSDVHYICAYQEAGEPVMANPMYGEKAWGAVGVHVDHEVDLRGWAYCGTEHRPNFAHTPAIIVDLNRDGLMEAVVTGNVYNCGTDPYTSLYEMPFIFNADRSRWSGDGFDWTNIPIPDGAAVPLSEDWHVIESNMSNPVAADLDGDGYLEIIYPSYDGRVHAYWLDKSEHGSWPYSVYDAIEGLYRFASEPVVVDLDDNGQAEVIFTSWVQKSTNRTGRLHILDYLGNPIHEVNLPPAYGSPNWNGALAAPTLADIDGDPDLEVVINSAHSGVLAYDLPGTANARLLWGTGRGNYQRSGSSLIGNLEGSHKLVSGPDPKPGETVSYTIVLKNPGPTLESVSLTDTLPAEVAFAGNLIASAGTASESSSVISWEGQIDGGAPVTIQFDARVDGGITDPRVIVNTVHIADGLGNVLERSAVLIVNGYSIYLPLSAR